MSEQGDERAGLGGPLGKALLAAAVVVVVLGARAAADVLNVVLLTLFFATIASPWVELLIRKGLGRVAAVAGVALIVLVAGFAIIFLVWSALPRLTDRLPVYADLLETRAAMAVVALERYGIYGSALLSSDVLGPARLVGMARNLVGAATSYVLQSLLLLLLTVFFLIDMEAHRARWRKGGLITEYVVNAHEVRRYLSITGLIGFVSAVANAGLLAALGIDFPILWGFLSFVTNFIPNIGFYLAVIPPLVLAWLEFGLARAVIILVGYFLINFVLDSILKPRFLQKGIGITPFETLVSLVFWSWVLGPTGAILAVPLTMVAKSALPKLAS